MLSDILRQRDLLPILKMNDGSPVTAENWNQRRRELFDALYTYSYGFTPAAPLRVWGEITHDNPKEYGFKIRYQKIRVFSRQKKVFSPFRSIFSFPNASKHRQSFCTLPSASA